MVAELLNPDHSTVHLGTCALQFAQYTQPGFDNSLTVSFMERGIQYSTDLSLVKPKWERLCSFQTIRLNESVIVPYVCTLKYSSVLHRTGSL
jgi:hypothetical protein